MPGVGENGLRNDHGKDVDRATTCPQRYTNKLRDGLAGLMVSMCTQASLDLRQDSQPQGKYNFDAGRAKFPRCPKAVDLCHLAR